MAIGKGTYLKKLMSRMQFQSVEAGEKMDGSSPPSVFIGSANYPKVLIGPMATSEHSDTSILDAPEQWIPGGKEIKDVVQFRLSLVRGKQAVGVRDLGNKLVQKLQEISLAKNSVDSHLEFRHKPRGVTFSDEHSPFGPSGELKHFETQSVKWEHHLEKAHYDTDLPAQDAVISLYKDGVPFSTIQKAFSTATMGLGKNRKLVPTRWSITAVDAALADNFLEEVKQFEILDNYLVYEFSALKNYFAILLTPGPWQYEWMEAFIRVMENEELIFSDYERFHKKTEYSSVGGCYYSVKLAVCEKLRQMRKQSGAIVFREAYPGYVPTGVWLCREETKHALSQKPEEFETMRSAVDYISSKLRLPLSRFVDSGVLLGEMLSHRQTMIAKYM